jgi:hypothetical protein
VPRSGGVASSFLIPLLWRGATKWWGGFFETVYWEFLFSTVYIYIKNATKLYISAPNIYRKQAFSIFI